MTSVDSRTVIGERAPRAGAHPFSEDTLKEISSAQGEPEWLLQRRLEAWRAYEQLPLPSRKDEEWRRTDLSMLELDSLTAFSSNDGSGGRGQAPALLEGTPVGRMEDLPAEIKATLMDEGNHAGLSVQVNSRTVYTHLEEGISARGVILSDLSRAAREHPDLVRPHLMAQLGPGSGKFGALHATFWSGGTFLYVPRNVEVEQPIHALRWMDAPGLSGMPHTLVVLGSGAALTLVEEYASGEGDGDPAFANTGVELVLGPGSRLHYVALQRWGTHTFNFSTQRAAIHRDAQLTTLSVVLGSRMTKSWVESSLMEPGAGAQMVGVMFAGEEQRFHHHTLQEHRAPNTSSDLLYKVALTGRARSEYSGLIRVHPFARGTDAYQANRNLLLSPRSRADSMPKLEIENNDVRCTHGATVGPIDEEQLFYLMARGLPRGEAERMIVEGFFEPVLERVPLEGVRERVRAAVEAKLSVQEAE